MGGIILLYRSRGPDRGNSVPKARVRRAAYSSTLNHAQSELWDTVLSF
jgi:hypothetical protein